MAVGHPKLTVMQRERSCTPAAIGQLGDHRSRTRVDPGTYTAPAARVPWAVQERAYRRRGLRPMHWLQRDGVGGVREGRVRDAVEGVQRHGVPAGADGLEADVRGDAGGAGER